MITQQDVQDLFDYNPETGEFFWKKKTSLRNWIGKKAGGVGVKGYVYLRINKKKHFAHRIAWLYVHGVLPSGQMDHINGIKNDNRISNLREATNSQNRQNLTAPFSKNKTGYRGVSLRRGYYCVCLKVNKKVVLYKEFKTAKEASDAYMAAKEKYHPFHERNVSA